MTTSGGRIRGAGKRRSGSGFLRILLGILLERAAAGPAAVLPVARDPGPGEYGSIRAALDAAAAGDTIRLVDNGAPFEEVVVVTLDDITLEGASWLDPRPAVAGPPAVNPFDPDVATAFTFNGARFVCRNLVLTTAPENETVVDCRFAEGSLFENVSITAHENALNAFQVQGAATLTDCEIRGGRYSLKMWFGGPVRLLRCSVGEDCRINGVYQSGGEIRFTDCFLTARHGLAVFRIRTHFEGVSARATFTSCVLTDRGSGSSDGDLIEIEPGDAPAETKTVVVDNCDLVGRGDRGAAVRYGGPAGVTIVDSIFQGFPGAVYGGIAADDDPPGFRLDESCCVYKECPGLDPGKIDSSTSRILELGDNLYLSVAERHLRIFDNSPAASINSTGVPPWAGSQGPAGIDGAEGWRRTQADLLRGFGNMYNPHVVRVPDDPAYPYRMFFFGWASADCNPGCSGCDAIFLARGTDLETWEVYSGEGAWDATGDPTLWVPVLTAEGGGAWYDQWHNGDPSVVLRDGVYVMAYSATGWDLDGIPPGQPGDLDDDISVVRGATSTDGIHWTRSAGPILVYEPEVGRPNDTTDPAYTGMFHRPSLMYDGDRWRLWFDYWVPGPGGTGMGYAECRGDPMNPGDWVVTHDPADPILRQWPNPDVVRCGDRYVAFSDTIGYPDGVGWPNRQIREAVSDDGIRWEIGDFLFPDSDTPANQVPEAYVERIDGTDWIHLFYSCQIGGDPYDFRYDRIRMMRRPLSGSSSSMSIY